MQRILQSFQRNSLKRFGWDYLALGPTSSVAVPLIPTGTLLFGPLSRHKPVQASPYSGHFSGCPHSVPRCLSSHQACAQYFCIQLALKQCDYHLEFFWLMALIHRNMLIKLFAFLPVEGAWAITITAWTQMPVICLFHEIPLMEDGIGPHRAAADFRGLSCPWKYL